MRSRPLPLLPGLLLTLLSMAAWAAEAETSPGPSLRFRSVLLTAKTEEVRVALRIPMTLTFDAEIDPEAVKRHAPARVRLLSISETSITLMAVGELGKGVELRVPFLNEPALAEPVFQLVTAADVVDAQVMVFRSTNAPELMQARLTELETRSAACEAELAAQRERGKATGPAGWVLSGQVEEGGVSVANLKRWSDSGTAGIRGVSVRRFRADGWVVLEVVVRNDSGQPWRPGRAWLESASTGSRVEARTVDMAAEVLPAGERGHVGVEFRGWPTREGEVFGLVVQDADGARPLAGTGVVIKDKMQEKSGP